jgi:hypothetical protein
MSVRSDVNIEIKNQIRCDLSVTLDLYTNQTWWSSCQQILRALFCDIQPNANYQPISDKLSYVCIKLLILHG